ncbi:MAG TPA: transglutaminase domain-containing protein [Planctomycetota bacterium]|nr:transglutaminase domain-containing protein [Planctomycetota bacterium]
MRLFYEQQSTMLRSELLLLGADAAAIGSIVLFASGALHGGAALSDVLLLLFWAAIPRALSKVVGQAGRFPSTGSIYLAGPLFVLFATVLILAGWELIESTSPREAPAQPAASVILFFAWGSGFLLFHPRAYRLHDFLLWATALVGLKDQRPLPHLLLPIFFSSYFLSCAVRHLLHDSFARTHRPRPNLQNARAVALLAGGAASIVFLGVYFVLHGGIDFPARGQAASGRQGTLRLESGAGGASPAETSPVDVTDASMAVPGADPRPGEERDGGAMKDTAGAGFACRLSLRDLSAARSDPREALRVRPEEGGEAGRDWRPSAGMLWRGIAFATFDARLGTWSEEGTARSADWPRGGTLVRDRGPAPDGPAILLRHRVLLRSARTLFLPYVTRDVRSDTFKRFRETSLGDIFPHPPPSTGTEYTALVLPLEAGALPAGPYQGPGEDPRNIAVPNRDEAGIDLRSMAREIFRGAGAGIESKLERIRAHFAASYRYSRNARWSGDRNPLAVFLEEEKAGDCTHFATAGTLLLRAGGVSARIAAGFVGGEWDEEKGEAVLRNDAAHAWIEVHVPRTGWHPFDLTEWVTADASYQPPGTPPEAADHPPGGEGPSEPETAAGDPAAPTSRPRSSPLDGRGVDARPDRVATARRGWSPPRGDRRDSEEDGRGEDDEGEGWIEYAAEWDQSGAGTRGPGPSTAGRSTAAVSSIPSGDTHRPGRGRVAVERTAGGREARQRSRSEEITRPGKLLRAVLTVFLAVLIPLLVLAYLRPRPDPAAKVGPEEGAQAPAGNTTTDSAPQIQLDEQDPRDRVLAEYFRLQDALARTRRHRRPHETPLEHARAMTGGREDVEKAFLDLHRILYRLIYGGESIDGRQADLAARSCRKLKSILG